MIINMPKDELVYCNAKISHCIYLNKNGTVYKDCESSPNKPDLLEKRLLYVSELPKIDGYTKPINLLADDAHIYGYEMEYLKDYKSLMAVINSLYKNKHIDFEDKKIILLKLIKCLKEINRSYIIGDIRLDNIMVNPKGDARIIDWENGVPIGAAYPILSYYRPLYLSNNIVQADSMKMFICILSLLYETNLENICLNFDFNELYSFIFNVDLDPLIKRYINDYAYEYITKGNGVIYFDEYLQKMKNLRHMNIQRVRKKISKEYQKYPYYY